MALAKDYLVHNGPEVGLVLHPGPWVMNKAMKNAHREVRHALMGGLGKFINHPELVVDRPELFRSDGVHLSKLLLDIFFPSRISRKGY